MTDHPGFNVVVAPEKNLTVTVWDATPAEVTSGDASPRLTQVWTGSRGARGDAGPAGTAFSYDAIDLRANRFAYDDAVEGYTFLASDTNEAFVKQSATSGDWGDPITLVQIAVGDTGASAVWQAKNAAGTARDAAQLAQTGAETAETGAVTAQGLSEDARDAAQLAQSAAETARTGAETAESNASSSASAASTSASNASASEGKAEEWAQSPEDTPVEVGQFSALHWSAKAEGFAATAEAAAATIPEPGADNLFLRGMATGNYDLRTASQLRSDLDLYTTGQVDTSVAAVQTNLTTHINDEAAGVHGSTVTGIALLQAADAASGRNTLDLGTAATANVQTSPTDTTAGRLMVVGAFGLGGQAVPASSSISMDDNTLPNGIYRFSPTTTPGTPPSTIDGTWLHYMREDGIRGHQIFFRQGSIRVFLRTYGGTSWSDWQEIQTTASIATQSEHNSPSGVEKLARLDRLEDAGWIGAGKIIQRGRIVRTTSSGHTGTEFTSIAQVNINVTPMRGDSTIYIRAVAPQARLSPTSGGQAQMIGRYRIYNNTDDVAGPEFGIGGQFPTPAEGNKFDESAIIEMFYTVDSTAQRNFSLQYRNVNSNTLWSLEASASVAAYIEFLEIAQ